MSDPLGIALLFVVLSVVGFFALYYLIETETSDPTVVDRETAEREAQREGGLRGQEESRRDRSTDDRAGERNREVER